MRNNHY
jgi:hypothetical protein